eukprot:1156504-Pelagomonas_calceolata.AAC.5
MHHLHSPLCLGGREAAAAAAALPLAVTMGDLPSAPAGACVVPKGPLLPSPPNATVLPKVALLRPRPSVSVLPKAALLPGPVMSPGRPYAEEGTRGLGPPSSRGRVEGKKQSSFTLCVHGGKAGKEMRKLKQTRC